MSATSDKVSATTDAAVVPGAPQRLSAQFALDNNVEGIGEQGVLLLWNPPANPPGAPVQTYKIERSIDGEDYTVRVSSHTANTTHWADPQEPPEGESLDVPRHGHQRCRPRYGDGHGHDPVSRRQATRTRQTLSPPPTSPIATAGSVVGTVDLKWMAGANATGHYVIGIPTADIAAGNYDNVIMPVMASSNSGHMVTGLQSGVEYSFLVIAVRGSGSSLEHSGAWVMLPQRDTQLMRGRLGAAIKRLTGCPRTGLQNPHLGRPVVGKDNLKEEIPTND